MRHQNQRPVTGLLDGPPAFGRVPAGIQIEHIRSMEGLRPLAGEWNDFLNRCGTDSVFLTWEYLWTWLEAYGDEYDLHVLVARGRAGELLGIAPMVVGRGSGRGRRHLRHLAWVGAIGESVGERMDFLVLRGREEEVVGALGCVIFGELADAWDVIYLAMVPAESPSLRAWQGVLEQHRAWAMELYRYASYYRPLPENWDTYLKERSGHFRSNFRRKWKKLEKEHAVRVVRAGVDCGLNEALDALIRLNRKRWGNEGQAFLTERFNRFHGLLIDRFTRRGWGHLSLIEIDGVAAAACYGFGYAGKFSVLQFGWDQEFRKQSIGLLALGVGQQLAMADGLRELDLLAGGEEYKKLWATEKRELVDFEIANPSSLRALGFQRLRALRNLVLPS